MKACSVNSMTVIVYIVSVFVILSVINSVDGFNMLVSLDKKQPMKKCISPCKIFPAMCKNNGVCKEQGIDCTWYCQCPENCEGFFCEHVVTEKQEPKQDDTEIADENKNSVDLQQKQDTSAFDKSKIAHALAGLLQNTPVDKKEEEKVNGGLEQSATVKENDTKTMIPICTPEELGNNTVSNTSNDVAKNIFDNDNKTSNQTHTQSSPKVKLFEIIEKALAVEPTDSSNKSEESVIANQTRVDIYADSVARIAINTSTSDKSSHLNVSNEVDSKNARRDYSSKPKIETTDSSVTTETYVSNFSQVTSTDYGNFIDPATIAIASPGSNADASVFTAQISPNASAYNSTNIIVRHNNNTLTTASVEIKSPITETENTHNPTTSNTMTTTISTTTTEATTKLPLATTTAVPLTTGSTLSTEPKQILSTAYGTTLSTETISFVSITDSSIAPSSSMSSTIVPATTPPTSTVSKTSIVTQSSSTTSVITSSPTTVVTTTSPTTSVITTAPTTIVTTSSPKTNLTTTSPTTTVTTTSPTITVTTTLPTTTVTTTSPTTTFTTSPTTTFTTSPTTTFTTSPTTSFTTLPTTTFTTSPTITVSSTQQTEAVKSTTSVSNKEPTIIISTSSQITASSTDKVSATTVTTTSNIKLHDLSIPNSDLSKSEHIVTAKSSTDVIIRAENSTSREISDTRMETVIPEKVRSSVLKAEGSGNPPSEFPQSEIQLTNVKAILHYLKIAKALLNVSDSGVELSAFESLLKNHIANVTYLNNATANSIGDTPASNNGFAVDLRVPATTNSPIHVAKEIQNTAVNASSLNESTPFDMDAITLEPDTPIMSDTSELRRTEGDSTLQSSVPQSYVADTNLANKNMSETNNKTEDTALTSTVPPSTTVKLKPLVSGTNFENIENANEYTNVDPISALLQQELSRKYIKLDQIKVDKSLFKTDLHGSL
ncbi:uncharacterized protein LOC127863125 [Dreissena polymorpha]|uniref:Uncharacterized protein n=1 Tax=Dreissena polymorpha TaxID=45954 RepID=A0A9D3Y7C4_DREPO|nr:uncharacterized protein LOC127863125 [Dreissena polymorpha]KAH3693160.1 hypothetical protein DPMN_192562 [Dreissena polymorpha]